VVSYPDTEPAACCLLSTAMIVFEAWSIVYKSAFESHVPRTLPGGGYRVEVSVLFDQPQARWDVMVRGGTVGSHQRPPLPSVSGTLVQVADEPPRFLLTDDLWQCHPDDACSISFSLPHAEDRSTLREAIAFYEQQDLNIPGVTAPVPLAVLDELDQLCHHMGAQFSIDGLRRLADRQKIAVPEVASKARLRDIICTSLRRYHSDCKWYLRKGAVKLDGICGKPVLVNWRVPLFLALSVFSRQPGPDALLVLVASGHKGALLVLKSDAPGQDFVDVISVCGDWPCGHQSFSLLLADHLSKDFLEEIMILGGFHEGKEFDVDTSLIEQALVGRGTLSDRNIISWHAPPRSIKVDSPPTLQGRALQEVAKSDPLLSGVLPHLVSGFDHVLRKPVDTILK